MEENANKILAGPMRLMIKTELLSKGSVNSPMSGQDMRLLALCKRHKIKWEEPDGAPYDRIWITLRTLNQKLLIINFFGLDKLVELAEK